MRPRLRALSLVAAGLVASAGLAGCVDLSRPSGARACSHTKSCDPGFLCDGTTCVARTDCNVDRYAFEDSTTDGFQALPMPGAFTALGNAAFVARAGSCGQGVLKLDAAFTLTVQKGGAVVMIPQGMGPVRGMTVYGDIRIEGATAPPSTLNAQMFASSDLSQPDSPLVAGPSQVVIPDAWVHLALPITYTGNVLEVGVVVGTGATTPVEWAGTVFVDQVGWQ
jgi:hypothetical protein